MPKKRRNRKTDKEQEREKKKIALELKFIECLNEKKRVSFSLVEMLLYSYMTALILTVSDHLTNNNITNERIQSEAFFGPMLVSLSLLGRQYKLLQKKRRIASLLKPILYPHNPSEVPASQVQQELEYITCKNSIISYSPDQLKKMIQALAEQTIQTKETKQDKVKTILFLALSILTKTLFYFSLFSDTTTYATRLSANVYLSGYVGQLFGICETMQLIQNQFPTTMSIPDDRWDTVCHVIHIELKTIQQRSYFSLPFRSNLYKKPDMWINALGDRVDYLNKQLQKNTITRNLRRLLSKYEMSRFALSRDFGDHSSLSLYTSLSALHFTLGGLNEFLLSLRRRVIPALDQKSIIKEAYDLVLRIATILDDYPTLNAGWMMLPETCKGTIPSTIFWTIVTIKLVFSFDLFVNLMFRTSDWHYVAAGSLFILNSVLHPLFKKMHLAFIKRYCTSNVTVSSDTTLILSGPYHQVAADLMLLRYIGAYSPNVCSPYQGTQEIDVLAPELTLRNIMGAAWSYRSIKTDILLFFYNNEIKLKKRIDQNIDRIINKRNRVSYLKVDPTKKFVLYCLNLSEFPPEEALGLSQAIQNSALLNYSGFTNFNEALPVIEWQIDNVDEQDLLYFIQDQAKRAQKTKGPDIAKGNYAYRTHHHTKRRKNKKSSTIPKSQNDTIHPQKEKQSIHHHFFEPKLRKTDSTVIISLVRYKQNQETQFIFTLPLLKHLSNQLKEHYQNTHELLTTIRRLLYYPPANRVFGCGAQTVTSGERFKGQLLLKVGHQKGLKLKFFSGTRVLCEKDASGKWLATACWEKNASRIDRFSPPKQEQINSAHTDNHENRVSNSF